MKQYLIVLHSLLFLFLCFQFTGNSCATVIKLDSSYYVIPDQNQENIYNDNDGYTEVQGDCDDSNPVIHPGAAETCGDGIDPFLGN